MKVLLSWSGPRSKAMASALRDWLPNILQSIDIWMSDSDIDIGSRWGPDLDKELEKSQFGILCLTPESMSSTWIHYEAGALSKFVDKSYVCPYLLDLQPTDIKGPLVNFQAARANKEDTLKLIQTINHATGDRILPDARVSTIFERFWPDLEAALASIPSEANRATEPSRPQKDMVEEILKIVRDQSKAMAEIQSKLAALEGEGKGITRLERKKINKLPNVCPHTTYRGISGLRTYEIAYTAQDMDMGTMHQIMNRFEMATGDKDTSREDASKRLGEIAKHYGFKGEMHLISWESSA